jgi:tellurite resistance protein
MFLRELNKDESMCFLNLVSIFAKVDNKFAKEEKVLVDEYREELGIYSEEIKTMEYDEIINILKKSSDKAKKIIYFELVGLALVDGEYEDEEVDFLEKIADEFNIARAKKFAIANYFYNFKDVYNFTTIDADNNIKLLKDQAEAIIN